MEDLEKNELYENETKYLVMIAVYSPRMGFFIFVHDIMPGGVNSLCPISKSI